MAEFPLAAGFKGKIADWRGIFLLFQRGMASCRPKLLPPAKPTAGKLPFQKFPLERKERGRGSPPITEQLPLAIGGSGKVFTGAFPFTSERKQNTLRFCLQKKRKLKGNSLAFAVWNYDLTV